MALALALARSDAGRGGGGRGPASARMRSVQSLENSRPGRRSAAGSAPPPSPAIARA
jgi:hypothetical protein